MHHPKYRIQGGLNSLHWEIYITYITDLHLATVMREATFTIKLFVPQIANIHIFLTTNRVARNSHRCQIEKIKINKTDQMKTKKQNSYSLVHEALNFRASPSLGGHRVQIKSTPDSMKFVYAGEPGGRDLKKSVISMHFFCGKHCASPPHSLFPSSLWGWHDYHPCITSEETG